MIEIAVQDLNKYYGSNHVIRGISFEIFKGEKVGLIGKNGSGKTTLFKIIAGIEEYESGNIMKTSDIRIEVFEQIPVFKDVYTVEDVLHTAFDELSLISEEMRRLEEQIRNTHNRFTVKNSIQENMNSNAQADPDTGMRTNTGTSNRTDLERLLTRYGRLQTQYESMGGYDFESKIDKVCSGMKVDVELRKRHFATLSGGEQTRVNLARILLRDADILLLDEPTNHLDLGSIQWVEEYLKNYTGTVMVISHDRYFLDNVVTRIIEIDDKGLSFYEGNYSYYAEERERRFSIQSARFEQQQRKIKQLEAAAKRLHEWAKNADNPALHKSAFSIEKRIGRMERIDKPIKAKKITAEFRERGFSSGDMAVFKDISKSYGSKSLFNGVDLTIYKNDRIALIGENGCGKSTLIKLLTGDESPDQGVVKTGNSVRMAYLPQVIEFEENEATVIGTIRYALGINEEKARRVLAAFHFRGEDILKKVGTLSGGEKSRLKLCILMQDDINFLVMDEPTNHLDIPSREWIEEAVSRFDCTLLFISHDRYFINKFTTRVWEMKDGQITDYEGTFQEYCDWVQEFTGAKNNRRLVQEGKNSQKGNTKKKKNNKKCKSNKLGNGTQASVYETLRLIRDIENQIAEAEIRLEGICRDMDAAASDFEKLNALYLEKVKLEKSLDLLYNKWDELDEQDD